MMKKARIIYNPTAGRESLKRELPNVVDRLEEAGYETSAHATTGEGDAKKATEAAVEGGLGIVIVAGGDGTINDVVQGMAEKEYRPMLGIVPVGSTRDFARALYIPRAVGTGVDVIVDAHSLLLAICKV